MWDGKDRKKSEKRADPPPPPLRVSVTGHPILTIMFLVFLFFLHSFADLPMGSYVILAILGYYIRSLCGPELSFDYHLLLRTPPSEWLHIKKEIFSSHKNMITTPSEEELVEKV